MAAGIVSTDPWSAGATFFEVQKDRTLAARINSGGAVSTGSNAVPIGSWTHVAYTIAGAGAIELALYQNGGLIGTGAGYASNNLTDVNIAREYSGRYLNGKVDEVRVSSVARSRRMALGDQCEHRLARDVPSRRTGGDLLRGRPRRR